jgi:hypothetical protein
MHKLALEQRRLAAQMKSIMKKKSTEHQGIMIKRVKQVRRDDMVADRLAMCMASLLLLWMRFDSQA